MDKATEKEVIDVLRVNGLEVAEDMAVPAVKTAFNIVRILVPKISNGLGSIIVPLTFYAEEEILKLVDKIDGKDDPNY